METDRTRRSVLQVTGGALALGLAGCAGDTTEGASEATETATETATPTATPTETETETPTEIETETETPEETQNGEGDDGGEGENSPDVDLDLEEPHHVLHAAPLPEDPSRKPYPTMGSDDAPLKVTFFGGLKCQYTRNFVNGFLNDVVEEFVETGRVQIEFQFVPYRDGSAFHGQDEVRLTRAAYAIWHSDPENFFRFMEYNYENFQRPNGWWTPDRIAVVANEAGASSGEWIRHALKAKKYTEAMDDTMEMVRTIPVDAIPKLYVSPEDLGFDASEDDDEDAVQGLLLAPNTNRHGTVSGLGDAIETAREVNAESERNALFGGYGLF